MDRLQALPNEITLSVINYLHPSAIEPFALTSKHLYALSAARLAQHAALKSQYSTIHLTLDFTGGNLSRCQLEQSRHPVFILAEILEHRELAYYPTAIRLEKACNDGHAMKKPSKFKTTAWKLLRHHKTDLIRIGTENMFITDSDDRKFWHSAMTDWLEADALTAILMMLCENIHSMSITHCSDQVFLIKDMVSAIASANKDSTSPGHLKALSRFNKFEIEGDSMGEFMDPCIEFRDLPSIRYLGGSRVVGIVKPHNPEAFCGVTTMKFLNSAVGACVFGGFLSQMANLTDFTYHHIYTLGLTRNGGWVIEYEPNRIVDHLKFHASNSLEYLDITVDYEAIEYAEKPKNVGSLRSFKKLRDIRVNDTAFGDPDPSAWLTEISNAYGHQASYIDRALEDEVAQLIQILPASAEVLRSVPNRGRETNKPGEDKYYRRLFSGFARKRLEKTPKLKTVIWEGPPPLHGETRRRLDALGIIIEGAPQQCS